MSRPSTRSTHLAAVTACLTGAGLALLAVTRTWSVTVEQRTGLSDLRTERTGAEAEPWLIGLALVALAGTGALLATRGGVRRGLGVLLTLVGAGIAVGAVLARVRTAPGEAGTAALLWPVACVIGGAVVAVGGVLAARHGHLWAAMSARYDRRPPVAAEETTTAAGTTPDSQSRAFWDALDRGDDPTAR